MATVYTRIYDAPPVNLKEIFRYAGAKQATPELRAIVSDCLAEIKDRLKYKVCYAELDISFFEGGIDLGFMKSNSRDLSKNLSGCQKIVLFAATVGLEIDRLIARYGATSPTKSLIFDAIGAERIESLCNAFNSEMAENLAANGYKTRPRFSAGYGDFAIEAQRDIFDALTCPAKIGLSLGDNLLMSPSKSVTAIIGIYNNQEK